MIGVCKYPPQNVPPQISAKIGLYLLLDRPFSESGEWWPEGRASVKTFAQGSTFPEPSCLDRSCYDRTMYSPGGISRGEVFRNKKVPRGEWISHGSSKSYAGASRRGRDLKAVGKKRWAPGETVAATLQRFLNCREPQLWQTALYICVFALVCSLERVRIAATKERSPRALPKSGGGNRND